MRPDTKAIIVNLAHEHGLLLVLTTHSMSVQLFEDSYFLTLLPHHPLDIV